MIGAGDVRAGIMMQYESDQKQLKESEDTDQESESLLDGSRESH
jgi:hypothetical protein